MYRFAASDEDNAAVMALWRHDFESYEPYFSWYFEHVYKPQLTLCDFEGDELAACLQLAPYFIQLRGARLPVVYLVGVITDPRYRGQGRGHALLKEAQQWMWCNYYVASLFYTDIPGYYQPLGYRHCYQRQLLRVDARELAVLCKPGPGRWRNVGYEKGFTGLDQIYKKMTARYQGYVLREMRNWQTYLGEQSCDGAQIRLLKNAAYTISVVEDDALVLRELGFADVEGLNYALAEAARLALQHKLETVVWPAPLDIPRLLPSLKKGSFYRQPFVMARVEDLTLALCAFRYDKELRCELGFDVRGVAANKSFVLQIKEGKGTVIPANLGYIPAHKSARISADPPTLSKLLFGALSEPETRALAADEHSAELVLRALPPLNGWINEYT